MEDPTEDLSSSHIPFKLLQYTYNLRWWEMIITPFKYIPQINNHFQKVLSESLPPLDTSLQQYLSRGKYFNWIKRKFKKWTHKNNLHGENQAKQNKRSPPSIENYSYTKFCIPVSSSEIEWFTELQARECQLSLNI